MVLRSVNDMNGIDLYQTEQPPRYNTVLFLYTPCSRNVKSDIEQSEQKNKKIYKISRCLNITTLTKQAIRFKNNFINFL